MDHAMQGSAGRYVRVLIAVWAVILAAWVLTRAQRGPTTSAARGAQLFRTAFTPTQGLGPLFNKRSCSGCHGYPVAGGVGAGGLATELRVGRPGPAGFDPMVGRGGPVAREHSVSELGTPCSLRPGVPAGADITSVRNTPPLFGDGLIDAIPDRVILARTAAERRVGILGRPNLIRGPDGRVRVGRFGWKADVASLGVFVAQALRNELGITSPLAPSDFVSARHQPCVGESSRPEAGLPVLSALADFVRSLPAPAPHTAQPKGQEVFAQIGCGVCHTPVLQAGRTPVHLYSDLLLHDMGPALDDRMVQESATGDEWRTAPLWGLSERTRYLHDGRATTLVRAVLDHGGDAAPARARFRRLAPSLRRALLAFLSSL
jgi:CxxC motif-containing protein (DUF1111 family)